MTVDCDVHQGNGTAAIFAGTRTASAVLPSAGASTLDSSVLSAALPGKIRGAHAGEVFTISLHQHNNYPLWKPPSSIDVDLPDGIGDDDYLAWLDNALSSGLRQFEPDLICYVAGADPYREDQLGGLSLTIEGLKRRDELVFRVARARGIPVMVTYAGGYAQKVEDTVTIHCNTVVAAKEVFGLTPSGGAASFPAAKINNYLMFENLQEKLQLAFKTLRGQARLSEENITRRCVKSAWRCLRPTSTSKSSRNSSTASRPKLSARKC